MNNDLQNRMNCSEFEALLADALDGSLTAKAREDFDLHGKSCSTCGPLWTEAREGMLLVGALEELEPPQNLVHNILAATSMQHAGAQSAEAPVKAGWLDRLRAGLRPSVAGLMHSRFATSFAMAFFSLSLTLTLAGVKISDVRNIDWHPSALRKSVVLGYTQVEAKVTSYYENLRLVYEVQARVRELKKDTAPAQETSEPSNDNKQQNWNSAPDDGGRPRQKENYSRDINGTQIARSTAKHEGAQI